MATKTLDNVTKLLGVPIRAIATPIKKSQKKTPRHNSGGFFQLMNSCRLTELTRRRSNQERRISQDIPHRKVS
ncbi:hypothetical protein, partial [Laspinema olomoucense]|uniref:hypothetical protein n=1 Tax=Laspinema olomoucense TaxID=3231600 RepID=UPI0021BAF4F3